MKSLAGELTREKCLAILLRGATNGELRKWAKVVLSRPGRLMRRNKDGTFSFEPLPPRRRGRPPRLATAKTVLAVSAPVLTMMEDMASRWRRDLWDSFSLYEDARREARRRSKKVPVPVPPTDILRERFEGAVAPGRVPGLIIEIRKVHSFVLEHHGKTKAEVRRSLGLVSERTARRMRAREKHRKLSGKNRPN